MGTEVESHNPQVGFFGAQLKKKRAENEANVKAKPNKVDMDSPAKSNNSDDSDSETKHVHEDENQENGKASENEDEDESEGEDDATDKKAKTSSTNDKEKDKIKTPKKSEMEENEEGKTRKDNKSQPKKEKSEKQEEVKPVQRTQEDKKNNRKEATPAHPMTSNTNSSAPQKPSSSSSSSPALPKPGIGIERHLKKLNNVNPHKKDKLEFMKERFAHGATLAADEHKGGSSAQTSREETPVDVDKADPTKKLISLCANLFTFAPKAVENMRKIVTMRLYLLLSKMVLPKLMYDGTPMAVDLKKIQSQIHLSVFRPNPELAGHRVSCKYIRKIIVTDILPAMNNEIESVDLGQQDENKFDQAIESLPVSARLKEIPDSKVPESYRKSDVLWIMVSIKMDVDDLKEDSWEAEEESSNYRFGKKKRRSSESEHEESADESMQEDSENSDEDKKYDHRKKKRRA